jgi:hypothetical protein
MDALMKGLLLTALTLLGTTVSQAATINAEKAVGSGYYISIDGEINWSDGANFARVIEAHHITNSIVVLNSPGGLAGPGLEIARMVKDKRFGTYVRSGKECYSACAIIWLSGSARFVGRTSVIGFHGVWSYKPLSSLIGGNETSQSFSGNVEAAKYLLKLGLSSETVKALLTPGPDDFLILNTENAPRLGISFTLWDKPNIFLAG